MCATLLQLSRKVTGLQTVICYQSVIRGLRKNIFKIFKKNQQSIADVVLICKNNQQSVKEPVTVP